MSSMLRLATRLAAGGGRESLARTALTAAGLALAVALLLVAAVAFPALEAHDVRGAWRHTSEDNVVPEQDESATDPLLWRLTQDRYDGRDLVRVDLAAEGPDSPVPPGLDELPGPGEVAVSPALRDLIAGCEGTTFLDVTPSDVEQTGVTSPLTPDELAELPVVSMAAVTDGEVASIERARTVLGAALPGTPVVTGTDIDAETQETFRTMQRVSNIALAVTLVIAGCSLAVAVAGTIVERRQPFALLRLAGTGLSDLRRIVIAEAAAPLLMVATASAGLGLAVSAVVLSTTGGGSRPFVLPGAGYWLSLAGGLAAALVVVLATLPLLDRLTSLDSARFE